MLAHVGRISATHVIQINHLAAIQLRDSQELSCTWIVLFGSFPPPTAVAANCTVLVSGYS